VRNHTSQHPSWGLDEVRASRREKEEGGTPARHLGAAEEGRAAKKGYGLRSIWSRRSAIKTDKKSPVL